MSKMIPAVQARYGCASVSVHYYGPTEHFPKGFWSAVMIGAQTPAVRHLRTHHGTNPRLALAKICDELDFILLLEEEAQNFRAASAGWFKKSAELEVAA